MASARSRTGTPAGRVEGGVALVAVGATLLLVSLFLDWYEPGRSAWTVFDAWDLVLAVLCVVALAGVAGRLGLARRRADSWLVLPSVAALVIVVASLLNHPPPALDEDPMIGIWLALVGTILMVLGVALSVARVSVAIDVHGGAAGTPPAADTGTVTGAQERPPFRPRPTDAPSAQTRAADAPTTGVPTEPKRPPDDNPTRRPEPPGSVR